MKFALEVGAGGDLGIHCLLRAPLCVLLRFTSLPPPCISLWSTEGAPLLEAPVTRGPAPVTSQPTLLCKAVQGALPRPHCPAHPGGTTVPITGTAHLCVYYDSFGQGEDTCLFLIDTKALCALAVPLTRPLAWSGRTGVSSWRAGGKTSVWPPFPHVLAQAVPLPGRCENSRGSLQWGGGTLPHLRPF